MIPSLVPFRVVLLMLVFILAVMFWPLKLLQWDKYSYSCYNGKSVSVGESLIQIGRLSIHPAKYDCPAKDRYNPKVDKPLRQAEPDALPDYTN